MSWTRVSDGTKAGDNEVVLQTKDSILFKGPKATLERSSLIKELLEARGDGDDTIPISDVEANTLELVLYWLQHHAGGAAMPTKVPRPLRKPLVEYVTPFEWEFITTKCLEGGDEAKHLNLLLVMKAANFLGISELRELSTAMLAHMLKNKDIDQLHVLFAMELKGKRLGPAEFEKLYEKFPWMREVKA